jgi:two-component system alkaline phosphatase synthesis response regulator PhoP
MPSKKILVVEDQEEIREIIGLSLEEVGGWQVLFAEPGPEVILRAQTEQPDAILLDANMPRMDGPSTFQALRANPQTQQIPVILLTASVQKADAQRFAEFAFAAVLAKPFDPLSLPAQISSALGWESS